MEHDNLALAIKCLEKEISLPEHGNVRKALEHLKGVTNKYEDACKEWSKGCSCAEHGNPEQCKECTEAFLNHIKTLNTEGVK